ncbi:hypothetical protein BCF46_0947 [Litoreibacter meonggei]|uniref:General secretion pathway protein N n=1 Tax=Litoreibacter meonggei TaxID=1049199 RepID=A0A497X6G9_9RHOB|nr:hypothetical protein [Litoreibacter meonggei]RLJ60742.1 hypothetical protein BCF46_0947 [Litoreibacter meonggei]
MKVLLPILGTAGLLSFVAGAAYLVSIPQSEVKLPAEDDQFASETVVNSPDAGNTNMVPVAHSDSFYAPITDRPLFAQSRRPHEQAPAAIEEIPEEIVVETPAPVEMLVLPEPNILLLGVLTGGVRNSALISVDGSPPAWQREGSDIQGWQLNAIDADAIHLSAHERSLRIDLYRK